MRLGSCVRRWRVGTELGGQVVVVLEGRFSSSGSGMVEGNGSLEGVDWV